MLNRRCLAVGLPLGTLAAPWVRAQQKPKVIGVLSFYNRQKDEASRTAFVQAMLELGYVEDKHFVFAIRFADEKNDRLPVLAAELVRLNVDVILASSTNVALAAVQRATAAIGLIGAE